MSLKTWKKYLTQVVAFITDYLNTLFLVSLSPMINAEQKTLKASPCEAVFKLT